MATVNVFVANAKSDSEDTVQSAIEKFKLRFSKNTYVFVTGFQDWQLNFKRLGSWDAWEKNVVYGMKYGTVEVWYYLLHQPHNWEGNCEHCAACVDYGNKGCAVGP